MEIQQLLSLLFRWLHIVPAIILVGGTLFLRFSWVPAAQEAGANDEIREAIRRRWARLVMLSVLCLLISGLYNIHDKATHYKMDGAYLALLGIKILLALFVFYLAAIISGRSQTAIRFREKEVFWLNVLCVAMLGIVCIAGYLKVDPLPKKEKLESQSGPVSIWISPVANEWLAVHHVGAGRRPS